MKEKVLCLLFLSIAFLFFLYPKAYAMESNTGLEVIVPEEGWTELDLKSEVFMYRGSLGSPVKVSSRTPQMYLTAVEIDYDLKKQLLVARKQVNVQVKEEEKSINAVSSEITANAESLNLSNGGEITLISEGIKLVTESFIYLFQDSFYEADGGFLITKGDWSLSGQHLEGKINDNTLVATGNLRFIQGMTEGKAERISYSKDEGKMILAGSPAICWENGYLVGEANTVIIYYLDTGKVKAEGPTNIRFFREIEVESGGN